MHVSLSEVETTIYKAALGVGLPVGLGENAGSAARYMMETGLGMVGIFEESLHALEQRRSDGFKIDYSFPTRFNPKVGGRMLSSIMVAPSACDFATMIKTENAEVATVTLSEVDVPGVILFEALVNTLDTSHGYCVSWNPGDRRSVEAACWNGLLYFIKGTRQDLIMSGPCDITITSILEEPTKIGAKPDPLAGHEKTEIDASSWKRIRNYADRLFVGSTETSRLFGAGSGGLIEID